MRFESKNTERRRENQSFSENTSLNFLDKSDLKVRIALKNLKARLQFQLNRGF